MHSQSMTRTVWSLRIVKTGGWCGGTWAKMGNGGSGNQMLWESIQFGLVTASGDEQFQDLRRISQAKLEVTTPLIFNNSMALVTPIDALLKRSRGAQGTIHQHDGLCPWPQVVGRLWYVHGRHNYMRLVLPVYCTLIDPLLFGYFVVCPWPQALRQPSPGEPFSKQPLLGLP